MADPEQNTSETQGGLFRRVFKNAGFLLSGKAATGVIGLAYLTLAARGLGLEAFGILILVQTYLAVIADLSTFQAWQAVIRYGALADERNDTAGFQSLISFTTVLDVIGSLIGTGLAFVLAPLIGPKLGWSADVIGYAQAASFLILFTMTATPTGLLRYYDRFDLLAIQVVVKPAVRLLGAVVAFLMDAGIWAYVAAWFAGAVAGGVVLFWMGWREGLKRGRLTGMSWRLNGVTEKHAGIVRFSVASNLQSSLQVIPNHMSTLLVGWAANASAAGLYKIARDVATALTAPAELLTQSVYPELAKLVSKGQTASFSWLIVRSGATAAGAAACILIAMFFVGEPLIAAFFGDDYSAAYVCLLLLTAAAVVTVAEFPLSPALYALGRPGLPVTIMSTGLVAVYLPLLFILAGRYGAAGAGAAMLASATLVFLGLGLATVLSLAAVKSQKKEGGP